MAKLRARYLSSFGIHVRCFSATIRCQIWESISIAPRAHGSCRRKRRKTDWHKQKRTAVAGETRMSREQKESLLLSHTEQSDEWTGWCTVESEPVPPQRSPLAQDPHWPPAPFVPD